MENKEYTMNLVIQQIVRDMQKQDLLTCQGLDSYLDKEIITKMGIFAGKSNKIIADLKQVLFDATIKSPYKFFVIMYASLLFGQNQLSSGLLSFYYEFASYALKELKEGPQEPQKLWSILFEKIYYFGLLLLTGNRTLLLSMHTFGTRVNSQLLASKAQSNKISKLIRIYNCLLCIPQNYLHLNQVLTLTIIFTRWNLSENNPFSLTFFASFQRKTQKKLIKKLKRYPSFEFTQQHILNLIKIVVCGEELIFSYFLQAKFIYENSKQQSTQGKQRSAVEGLLKVEVPKQCKRLYNLIIELLLEAPQQALGGIQRQSILYIALKCLAGKFQNNEGLFTILISHFLDEKNSIISHLSFRIIREEALIYLTVYKVKLLLNLFNRSNWKKLLTAGVTGQMVINRLQKMIMLLSALGRRYNDENLNLVCLPGQCALSIQNVKQVKSIVFVIVFDSIGRLSQPSNMNACLLRIRMDKGPKIEVLVKFDENPQKFSIEPKKQTRQRTALVVVKQGDKNLLSERKQYLRFGQGNYESLVAATLIDGGRLLNLSIDGAYYQINLGKKNEIKGFELGQCFGCIRSFYSLNCELQLIELYKRWCQCQRKTKYVIESYGFEKYCFLLNTHQQPPVLQLQEQKWSLFQRKTQIKIFQAIKQHKIIETYLQLGGLQTIFFVLERLSRSFEELQGCQEKIVELLKNFFQMLRLTAYFDEKYHFINDIIKCFKFINPFLYLLINRNSTIKKAEDSRLLLSFFQMIVYFQRDKHRVQKIPDMEVKMAKIQTKLVISTLSNFQLWSNCSLPIQLFILSLIESYISNGKYIVQLVRIDLHKELLSSIVLFSTSENFLPAYEQLQTRLAEVCMSLYRKIQKQYNMISDLKETHLDKQGQKTQFFIERDIKLAIALIKSLSQRTVERELSQSERSAFEILLRYLSKNFLKNDFGWKLSTKYWPMCAFSLCNMVRIDLKWNGDLGRLLAEVIMKYITHEPSNDWWYLYFFNGFIDNKKTTIVDCLRVLHSIVEKYDIVTPAKTTIIAKIINKTAEKITKQDVQVLVKIRQDLAQQFNRVAKKGFFRISCYKDYNLLLNRFKESYFLSQIDRTIWKSINKRLFHLLFKQGSIAAVNRDLVKFLLVNMYEGDQQKIQHEVTKKDIIMVQKLIEAHKNVQSSIEVSDITVGAYALVQHCRGWPALYFLFKEGFLTGAGDLPLPFDYSDINQNQCPGGIISYYLAGKCQPLEIYLLLNIIIYRQLGNRLSFLSTIAPVSIFQKILELVISLSQTKPKQGLIAIILVLLRQVINSLNRGYVIRSGNVSKQLQKILGQPEKQKKKASEILQALLKGTKCVQNSLEGSQPNQDLVALIDCIIDKIKVLNELQDEEQKLKVLLGLSQYLKDPKHIYYHKLTMIGCRFFEVARQYWKMVGLPQADVEAIHDKISQTKIKDEDLCILFWNQLDPRYQKVLVEFNQRGLASQKHWKKLLISNEHWFELQGNLDDMSTKFYELDQKEVGPFGFYKLNIRPVKAQVRKLPYPRRKEYKQLIQKNEQEHKFNESAMIPKLSIETSTYFASVVDTNKIDNLQKVINSREVYTSNAKEKSSKWEWWCEWVTKRGVYAGKLKRQNKDLIFIFTGHSELPKDIVYQQSTNKCHWIQKLNDWEEQQFRQFYVPILGSEIFTRRYILRHTAFQVFSRNAHRSFFFNLFFQKDMKSIFDTFKGLKIDVIENRRQQFEQRNYTAKWQKGQLTNFEYLSLINRYSGRSTNDLGQYLIMPWVLTNFKEKDNQRQNYMKFLTKKQNLRDLSLPTGKLNPQKFSKLKMRLNQIDPNDIEIRFLYGTMYSNPTILYNFFIRLQPYTSLHWVHQGRKIDHADRLFSGVAQQFSTILSSSSDNKQLTPQFYYWPQFLRNRNLIELGRKQKGDEVHSVVLPPWARTPQQFVFKMREVLESKVVSDNLHNWIDLIFGQKAPYDVAEQYDNLYHYQCYQHDIFTFYDTQVQRKTAQIAISEFGQIPETIFFSKHLQREARKDIEIDQVITLVKPNKGAIIQGFELKGSGMIMWSNQIITFKMAAIAGFYHAFEWSNQFESNGYCHLLSIKDQKWLSLNGGLLKLFQKRKMKEKKLLDAQCLEKMGEYFLIGVGSKIQIYRIIEDKFHIFSTLFGHHSEIILIKTEPLLDVILSVDKSGLVIIHQLTQLRFLRAFNLGIQFTTQDVSKLKVCIHHMGYFIFLDHQQTIFVYNFLGEQLLEQEMEIKGGYENEDEIITDIQLLSHHQPIILGSTSRGNIYVMNFLQIIRFKEHYPYKNFSRLNKNLLSAVPKRSRNSIVKFSIVLSRGSSDTIYQFIVLYADGELSCFIENRQMGRQLKDNYRLKSMGFV